MSDEALERFRGFLARRHGAGSHERDVLLHEMGATINRHRLTGQDEGLHSLNTIQLANLVVGQPNWSRDQAFVTGLMLSSLIDGEFDIFDAALAEELIPKAWTWISWAHGFTGTEAELRRHLGGISAIRERCGAACLAIRTSPQAIGVNLLQDFCNTTMAKVYHRLLCVGLAGSQSADLAASELVRLAERLEVLFVEDTDATLSTLVTASTLDHPEILAAPFQDAAGDLTRTAIAQRHLERGRPQEALALVRDLRFLSSAYDRAILIAALAALECKKFEMVDFYSRNIADEDTRLKVVTRLAQATGDNGTELDALSRLYERNPLDAQVFLMLINLLSRIGQSALVHALCSEAQERFPDDQMVQRLIRPILAKGRPD
jgi:hypothetical protein